ncbi:MAG TPA: HAD family hydrolase [candidate division Zixibacteria bacterium]|nr:HAD family hydrolase [candidate division Zixibacteria bacterium]
MNWKQRGRRLRTIRIASFDLDGTLTDISFVDSVWLEGIPRQYAIKHGLAFEDAKSFVTREYGKVGREKLEWYDLSYWIRKLGLDISPGQILGSFQHRIAVFPEVTEALNDLKHMGYRLIIVTNARREFADLEIEKTKIGRYFERVFSATSDFGLIKKTPDIYEKACHICEVTPREMIHVGDDQCFDFEIPKKIGIEAFYLDRTGNHSGQSVIHSLMELGQKLATGP